MLTFLDAATAQQVRGDEHGRLGGATKYKKDYKVLR